MIESITYDAEIVRPEPSNEAFRGWRRNGRKKYT